VVGDGRSPTGWYTSASAEIVGHEFMHLVVGATSHFAYHEAGAVEEALADIFGVAMTARDDRLSGSWFGDDIDLAMRDLGDPTRSGQPDRYSRYRELPFSDDMGGVHTNSGILNKAHYLVTTGGRFNGIRVRTQGVAATTNVLREANQLLAWDPYTSMEEFALGVLGYCDLIAAIGGAIGNQGLDATCDAFSHAYLAVELLPGSSDLDLAIDSVQIGIDGNLDVVISNRSYLPEVPSEHFDLVIFDSLGSAITPALPATFQESVAPGESITVRTGVAAGFMGPFTRSSTAAISVELLPLPGYSNNDVDMSNNSASMEVGPDLVPVRLAWSEGPDLVEVSGRVTNIGRTGYAENTGAVVLVRDTASGELSVFDGVDVTLATDGGSPSRADDTGLRGIAFPEVQTVFVHGGREMPRNLISGTSRFAGTSSLYPLLQTWFDADGGRVELEGRFQVYLFVDAYDLVEETDETNNLLCVNCRGSSDIYDLPVVVRLPNEVDTDAIFPEPFRAAAAKLKSFRPFSRYPERFERERFSPHTPGPIVELP
jgi:hypothetical protein